MKYILVTGNKFLSKETNSSLKNLLSLVKLSLSPSGISTIFAWAYTLCGNRFPGSPWICRPAPNRVQIQGVPKKRGISECYSICFTAHLIWNVENSFLIHLKIDINMFTQSAKSFLNDIMGLRNIFLIFEFLCSLYLTVQL